MNTETSITKTQDLIDALRDDALLRLTWQTGSRPAAAGSYWLGNVRVYAAAVHGAEKIGAVKCVRANFISRQYVLTSKFRKAPKPSNP
jgi:hypothetical protein